MKYIYVIPLLTDRSCLLVLCLLSLVKSFKKEYLSMQCNKWYVLYTSIFCHICDVQRLFVTGIANQKMLLNITSISVNKCECMWQHKWCMMLLVPRLVSMPIYWNIQCSPPPMFYLKPSQRQYTAYIYVLPRTRQRQYTVSIYVLHGT
jgi:hypothetical protein